MPSVIRSFLAVAVLAVPVAVALSTGLAGPAAAEPRYAFRDMPDGALARLDTATGAISLCRMEGDSLVCRMAADDRVAYEERIAALEAQIAGKGPLALNGDGPAPDSIEEFKSTTRQMLEALIELRDDFERLEEAYSSPTPPSGDRL